MKLALLDHGERAVIAIDLDKISSIASVISALEEIRLTSSCCRDTCCPILETLIRVRYSLLRKGCEQELISKGKKGLKK